VTRAPAYEVTPCPVCSQTGGTIVADGDDIRTEVERRWIFHDQRLRPGVPLQNLVDRVVFSQDAPLRVEQCRNCGHVYRNPRERRESLEAAYRDDTPRPDVLRALFETQRRAYAAQIRRVVEVAGTSGRGIEVGSYVGGFLAAARDHGWAFEGLDVNRRAVEFTVSNGLSAVHSEIERLVPRQPYDAVTIWNTFEQLYDSRAAVRAARRLLRRGGLFVVRVPNGNFYARWRRRLSSPLAPVAERVLAHNNFLGFPYRQAFTERSLGELLRESDFDVVRVFGDTMVPIADKWTTAIGQLDEHAVKRIERLVEHGWQAPWVEVYSLAI
jgi:SAM-dependent methyltransferase